MNKPWRSIPSKRISLKQTTRLLYAAVPTVFFITLYTGAMEESVALMILTWMYNDLSGAEENFLVRNANNALGYVFYGAGSTRLACGYPTYTLNGSAYRWIALIWAVVTSTMQVQDLQDQEGDRARDRRTMPLVIGDSNTRWVLAILIIVWSAICPTYWRSQSLGYAIPLFVGTAIAFRTVLYRSVELISELFKSGVFG